MTDIETRDMPLNWDVFVTIRQGIASDLPPGKEQLMWTPDSATLIYGQRDAVYNDVHLYLAESNAHTRREWIAALDTISSLHPRAVIADHKRPGNDDDPRIIEEARQYIRDFDRVAETTTARELYDQMLSLYPERVNPGALWSSARALKP